MRRLNILLVVLALVLLFSSCGASKSKLEEGQVFVTIKSNGDVAIDYLMSDRDAEKEFDIDFDDKNKDIIKDMEEYFDDQKIEAKVTISKKTKDNIMLSVLFEEGEMKMYDLDYTLEDYADDYGYDDMDELAENVEFVYFKDGEDVDEDDLEKYEEYITMVIGGGEEGAYLSVPGKIEIVGENVDFERIDNKTIFIEDDSYGPVVFKK